MRRIVTDRVATHQRHAPRPSIPYGQEMPRESGRVFAYDYFLTGSDDAAIAEAQLDVRHADPCVEGSGIDPFAQMALLEDEFTAANHENASRAQRPAILYTDPATGEPIIMRVRPELTHALADAPDDQLAKSASRLSGHLGDFVGGPNTLQFLINMRWLAGLATSGWGNLYCIVSPDFGPPPD